MTEAAVPGWLAESGRPPSLEVVGVTKSFTDRHQNVVEALRVVDMYTAPGEFVALVGPSGCGKSTLFNIVAGLFQPSAGQVRIDGNDVTGTTGHAGYMLQSDLLLPWRTVLDNVILGLEVHRSERRRVSKAEARLRAADLLSRFGLSRFEHRYPAELSGGMRQRCAFARTLLYPENLLLLDEPLGALDVQTRMLMQEWLAGVLDQVGKTVLLVTHDIDEAVFLSDRIYVMSRRPGRLLDVIAVDLERPRQSGIRTDPRFVELRAQVFERIRTESVLALKAEEEGELI